MPPRSPPRSPPSRTRPTRAPASTRSRITSSNRLASTPLGSVRAGGSRTTRKIGTSSTRLRGARLGAGLTTIPSVPPIDPSKADPGRTRRCPRTVASAPSAATPVGRSREGRPGRAEGFCPHCRTPFSFTPKLKPGDIVGGQYEVQGCLAHGGLGWVYLARDTVLSGRWVVLKGLLNSGDPDAYAAAVAEREFLAKVEHPLIVEIYNFVLHEGAGYIVMEYVGGTSLKDLLKKRTAANGGVYDPMPVDQAIAYIVEILPAFSYLHDMGLLYCDFKPDNIIQVGDAVKLIDLGGVRRIDDLDSRDLRDRRLPGARGRGRRPVDRVRHLHARPHPRRAVDAVPRLPVDLRLLAAAGGGDAAVPAVRLLLPAARQGLRARPRRPVPDRRRAAGAADRRPARDRRDPDLRRRPCPALRAVRALRGTGRRVRRPGLEAPARAQARLGRPDGGVAVRPLRHRARRPAQRALRRARRRPSRCGWRWRGRRSPPAGPRSPTAC